MFEYEDPVGTDVLAKHGALLNYRLSLHLLYRKFAAMANSGFTLLEALSALDGGATSATTDVTWSAFPRSVNATFEEIDRRRFDFQDEYVEWLVERDRDGAITRVTFTTLFPEYFEALAEVSIDALRDGVRQFYPAANPTPEDLFGTGFDPAGAPPAARARQFRSHLRANPWNNGSRGILCLTQQFNSLHALFNLLGFCGVQKAGIPSSGVCAKVGGACGPQRNSDPKVCEAAQTLVRNGRVFALADPAGIQIRSLGGIWKLRGEQVDINAADQWGISHNGTRATLNVTRDLTIVDDTIRTGTAVAVQLAVAARVTSANESLVPAWAKTGFESSRALPT